MPSSYTHQSFAKRSISLFPKEIQDIILKYPKDFYFGSLGPDPLYFYGPLKGNPLYSLADDIHNHGIRKMLSDISSFDERKMCFLFGYISHYVLDKNCHEYIYQIDRDGKMHHIIEAELDKRIALSEKKEKKISFTSLMDTKGCDFSYMDEILGVDGKVYVLSVKSMRRLIGLLMTPHRIIRFFTRCCLSLTPRFKKYKETMFTETKRKELDEVMDILHEKMKMSIKEYVDDVISFHRYVKNEEKNIDFGDDMSFEGNRLDGGNKE